MTPSHEGQSLFINTTFATKAEVRWSLADGPKTTAQRCNSSTGTEAQPSLYNNADPKRWIPLVVRARGGGMKNARVLLIWMRTLTLTFWKWNSQQPIFAIFKRWEYAIVGRGGRVHGNRARTFQQNSLHTVRKGGWGRKTTNWILSASLHWQVRLTHSPLQVCFTTFCKRRIPEWDNRLKTRASWQTAIQQWSSTLKPQNPLREP